MQCRPCLADESVSGPCTLHSIDCKCIRRTARAAVIRFLRSSSSKYHHTTILPSSQAFTPMHLSSLLALLCTCLTCLAQLDPNDQSSVKNLPQYLTSPPGQCNGPQPLCSASQCAPSISVGGAGSNDGKCLSSDLFACPCSATIETQGHCESTPGPCDQDGCNGSNGHCTGKYNGCPCQDKPSSCPRRKPICEDAGCNGIVVGVLGSNEGKCQDSGDLNGCLCLATRSTPGHCGQQGPCDENGCNGMFVGVGTAVCMGQSWGCPCYM
jgi:hypothetical protein